MYFICIRIYVSVVKQTQKESGGFARKNDKDLSKGLRVYKLETRLGKKKKKKSFKEEKLRVLIVKVTSSGIISPASSALKLAQDSISQMSEVWMPGSLESGHREVWSHPESFRG